MWLTDISIKRPVFAVMIIAALAVLGWIALGRLGVDLFPKVEFPVVSISTQLDGAAPDVIESDVTDPIEEQVNTTSGIDTISSTSSEGRSQVIVEYDLSEDIDVKAQDVRDKVALARADLPVDAEQAIVQKVDPDAQPIMSIMIAGDVPIRELTRFADDTVKEQLQRLPGVGSIRVVGGRDREIRVWLDAAKMRAYHVTAADVINAIRQEHAQIPGGRLQTSDARSEFSVKTMGEVRRVQQFGDVVVAFREGGVPTYVKDVARVVDGMADERSYAELDGKRGISLEVRRQSGRNTVEVARAVRDDLERIRKLAPPGVTMQVARDNAVFVEAASNDVFDDIQLGVILVVLVTLAFLLSIRATLIVAVAMPASLIATFFAFYIAGFTINLMTLMALSMAVGMLVDDAIVVLEAIYRQLEKGVAPMEAAANGAKEVGLAVVAGALSICAVFVPIAFMGGVVGRFFYQYGLAITFAVLVSLLISLTLTPMLASRFLRPGDANPAEHNRIARFFENAYRSIDEPYRRLLAVALKVRWLVVLLAIASVVGGVMVARTLPSAFDTRADRAEFLGTVEFPFGTGLEETKIVAQRIARAATQVRHVETVFFTVGGDSRERVNVAEFYFGLTPKAERDVKFTAIMDEAREAMLAAAPEARHLSLSDVPWISGGGFSNFAMMYALQGPDLDVLEAKADWITSQMRKSPLFTDVQSSYDSGKPEVQVEVDRERAGDLGVPVRALAETVRTMVGGVKAAAFEEYGQRHDVRVRLEDDQRDDIAKLAMIQVRATDGQLIDISNLARFEVDAGPAQIERQNRSRRIAILANTPEGVALGEATAKMEEILSAADLPSGYVSSPEGKAKRMKETGQAIAFAFLLALTALYMILASQFNSFVQPLLIMLSAPLSFVGAFVALKLGNQEMTMFAQIGMLALMGLVMKNGILLVDYTNQLRTQGYDAREAVLQAGPVRLRPVLMTQISTIVGMIPVAISVSQGAEFRNAMGFLVIGGLISSTLLTLVVVPIAYTLMDDAGRGLGAFGRWVGRTAGRVTGRKPHRDAQGTAAE